MIMLNCKQSSRDRQRGVALLMALVALLVIGAITAGAILLSNTESNIGINFRDEQLAFFQPRPVLKRPATACKPASPIRSERRRFPPRFQGQQAAFSTS